MSIRVERLSHVYGECQVLRDISLRVEPGESVGIIGVSGGGKSTLLKLLSGLYAKQQGILEVNGQISPPEIRRQVAMVMQSAPLFPLSIRDNITCGHPASEETVLRAASAAQLDTWIAALPMGLDTFVGERGGQVSGGQAQRIAIARAILKDAPVILLDEAFSALDGETRNGILASMKDWARGKTVVSVSHQREALIHCGRILRLEGGRLHDAGI